MRKTRFIPALVILFALAGFFIVGVHRIPDDFINLEPRLGGEWDGLFVFIVYPLSLFVCGIAVGILLNGREALPYFAASAAVFLVMLVISRMLYGNRSADIGFEVFAYAAVLTVFTLIHAVGAAIPLAFKTIRSSAHASRGTRG